MSMLAQRVSRLKASPTLAIDAKAKAMKAAGENVINLGAGEPDFDTPMAAKEAAKKAIDANYTRYTPVDGIPSLKTTIQERAKREQGLDYALDEIMVGTGGKQCIYNLCQTILNPGDEVIIPAPYWVSYTAMVELAEGTPVIVETSKDTEFKITADLLEKHITPKTKMLMLNSPSNPTGMAYSSADLKALADVLKNHPNILIASDDMYEQILWSGEKFHNIAMVAPELKERTMILSGVSKAYCMTGWRIGYALGPKNIIGTMKKIQSQSTSNPCSIAQYAAEAALKNDPKETQMMVDAFKKRHDLVVKRLNELDGIHCLPGHGAFYCFPDVSELIQRLDGINDDLDLAAMLLEKAKVATVPGTAFGAPGFIRLSYAVSEEELNDAIDRIAQVI